MKRAPTREQRRAARLILDDARDGEQVSADAITDALGYSGDLPVPEDADDYDLQPVARERREDGREPAWLDNLPH